MTNNSTSGPVSFQTSPPVEIILMQLVTLLVMARMEAEGKIPI